MANTCRYEGDLTSKCLIREVLPFHKSKNSVSSLFAKKTKIHTYISKISEQNIGDEDSHGLLEFSQNGKQNSQRKNNYKEFCLDPPGLSNK